jgi:hypothetical protein
MSGKAALLGVCVLITAAISAFSASTALGTATSDLFTGQTYPVTVHGVETHGNTTIVTEAGTATCEHTVHGELSVASQTLTLKPTFTNCTAFGFASATVAVEGCDYLYHVTTKLAADKYQAHMDIVCPAGKSIKITTGTCKMEIKGQTGLTTVDFDDMTTMPESGNDVTLTDTVTGVAYTVTEDGFLCPFAGTGAKVNGEFKSHQPLTLKGFNQSGVQQRFDIG